MKQLLVLALLASSAAVAAQAQAQQRPAQRPAVVRSLQTPAAYGMAGCGLGSLVFKENNGTQILAATTNGTFGSQTFGITFGTSNCGASGKLTSKEQVESYIAANEHALKNDIARGNGEALNGLAELMGAKSQLEFNQNLKTNYSKIFAKNDMTAKELTNNLYNVLN